MKPEVGLSEALWKRREECPLGSDCRDPQPGLGRDPGECVAESSLGTVTWQTQC